MALKNTIGQSWAHIDVELQRRYDLISRLVEVVKGYARHEGETLAQTTRARSGISVEDANTSVRQDADLLGRIMMVVERYPELKANEQFAELQLALVETEDRIARRRSAYNECVSRYEIYRQTFPFVIVVWAGHYAPVTFFDADEQAANAIRVVLS